MTHNPLKICKILLPEDLANIPITLFEPNGEATVVRVTSSELENVYSKTTYKIKKTIINWQLNRF